MTTYIAGYAVAQITGHVIIKPNKADFRRGIDSARKHGGTYNPTTQTWAIPCYTRPNGDVGMDLDIAQGAANALGWTIIRYEAI